MSEPLFYVQTKGYQGNCLVWWRVDGHGYTCNLDDAWKVTAEQGKGLVRRGVDKLWRVDKIDAVTHRHVNCETLRAKGIRV